LPLVHNRDLFTESEFPRGAYAAFNVISLEHAEGIVMGAEAANIPVILQLSENAIHFHRGALAIGSAMVHVAQASMVAVALHLDHITDENLMHLAPELGFSSVMFDASAQPYEENLLRTKAAAQWCHDRGLWLESELGEIGGKDGAHAPGVRTDPTDAVAFVAHTGVDALAVAVGSSHAMTTKTASLDHDLIALLAHELPVPLVLHGSSGVPDSELAQAAREGLRKINVGTALNVSYTGRLREFLAANPETTDPRKYMTPGRDGIAQTVEHYLKVVSGT
jgi:fructose-bisphosphate aldolase class II